MKKASEVLLDAVNILDSEGWCRFGSVDAKGRRCAISALHEASKSDASPAPQGYYAASLMVSKILTEDYKYYESLAEYNDNVAKDKRYIQRLFRKAAKTLEAAGN